ncbi:MAG TPA: DUF503 domain-containing protein [Myxococcales bacterium]|nr:DUF503 domain-containing protein [Myxococcales bacterium]HIL81332.1 DUF503 domain-containing protein [Myxococcales bacterium]
MRVGAGLIELHVHGSRSLKQKRGVVKAIVQRLRNRFNISVAEVDGQETWQRAVLGLAVVGCDAQGVRRRLRTAVEFVESLHLAEIRGADVEILDVARTDFNEGTAEDDPLPWENE